MYLDEDFTESHREHKHPSGSTFLLKHLEYVWNTINKSYQTKNAVHLDKERDHIFIYITSSFRSNKVVQNLF